MLLLAQFKKILHERKSGEMKKESWGIREKLLVGILPFVIIGVIVLTVLSAYFSGNSIEAQVEQTMESELKANVNYVNDKLNVARSTAMNLARFVGNTYQNTTMDAYKEIFSKTILSDELYSGSGIWFEPNTFDANQKYVGPYWYRNGSQISETYEYSNDSYNYFNQDYYKNAKSLGKEGAIITDPYFDSTSGSIMSSCSAPIFDKAGKYIGCVTVDLNLKAVDELMAGIRVGEGGRAMLLSSAGTYIYTEDSAKVQNQLNISSDENSELAAAGKRILANESGVDAYDEYNLYYAAVPEVNWKMIIRMPQAEINEPATSLVKIMAIVCVIILVVAIVSVIIQATSISSSLERLKTFAGKLADGDLRIEPLEVKSNDEIGALTFAFNNMSQHLRKVITKMAVTAEQVAASSEELTASAQQSADASVNVAATVSEVSADISEQMRNIETALETIDAVSRDIKSMAQRAENVSTTSEKTAEAAQTGSTLMSEAVSSMNNIEKSVMSSATVVERLGENSKQIGQIVEEISGIAEQTNLLALNAAIEAARAGEHGRGFAVVSEEVRKLATASQESAEKIRTRIESIQTATEEAVNSMKAGTDDVKSGTAAIHEVGVQFTEILKMVEGIKEEISGINKAVQTVSIGAGNIVDITASIDKSSRATDERTKNISSSTETQSASNEEIAAASQALANLATDMNNVIAQFKF